MRVHIIGASGSGTSTLAAALAAAHGAEALDTDDYYWEPTEPPFQTARPVETRLALLTRALDERPRWVLAGSLCGWGDPLIPRFELVVFLWIPTAVRLARLRRRELERFGAEALAPGGALHDNHRAFLEWAAAYDEGDLSMRSRLRHETWLDALPCPVLRLEGEQPVGDQLERVVRRLASS